MRGSWLFVVAALTGCNAILGVHGFADPVDPDAPTMVTGVYHRKSISNDPLGRPSVQENPPGNLTLTLVRSDGSSTPIALGDMGEFAFPASGDYRLIADRGGTTSQYESAASHLDIGDVVFGRLDAELGTATLQFAVSNADPGNQPILTSTGVWTQTALPPSTGTGQLAWSAAAVLGAPGLLDATRGDRIQYTEYKSEPPVVRMTRSLVDAVTMTNGGTTVIGGALQPVAATSCVHLVSSEVEEMARLHAVTRPSATTKSSWAIAALPAPEVSGSGFSLVYRGEVTVANVDLDVSYGNPYEGATLVLVQQVYAYVDLAAAGAAPASVIDGMSWLVQPTAGCPSPTILAPTKASLPIDAAIDGQPLDADLQVLAITDDATVTWGAGDGDHGVYAVVLTELTVVAGTTTLVDRRIALTTSPHVVFDRVLFVPGHTYVISIGNTVGQARLAEGDFLTLASPVASSRLWAHPFVVAPAP